MDTIAPLLQLDQQCSTWANHHSHSCNLIASLLNITRQREQTLAQLDQQSTPSSFSSSSPSPSTLSLASTGTRKAPLLASRSLQLLIHKQTLEIESVFNQLYDALDTFKKTVQAMVALERQIESTIQRIDTSKLLETIHLPISSSSSLSLSSPPHTSQQPLSTATFTATASPKGSTRAKFSSGPSLLETAEISPLEVLDWVSRVRAMYSQELSLKESQIHPGMVALERFESLQELQRSWGLQRRIDFGLEQEIVERIKAYKRVREFSSRTPGSSASNRSRRSSFDASNCPCGVLKAVLQSSLEARQFYADLIDSEPTFLRELDLTLDWSTTYSDLKHVRDAVLKVPQILKLRLDCRNHNGPTMDIVNRGKRGNPLVQILMQRRHLVLIDFVGSDGFFSKSTNSVFEDTNSLAGAKGDGAMSVSAPSSRRGSLVSEMSISSSTATGMSMVSSAFSTLSLGSLGGGGGATQEPPTTHLREVHIDGNFDPKAHAGKLKSLLERSPKLFALTLTCKDLDFACAVYTIRELVSTYPMFRYLDLSSSQFSAVFDRLDPTSAFGKAPQREDLKPNLGIDNSLVVIERFGSDLETLLIDDSFSNEHVQLLERVTSERRKLKLLDMRIGFAMISNSAITEAGQQSLEIILRRPLQPVGPPIAAGGGSGGGAVTSMLMHAQLQQQQQHTGAGFLQVPGYDQPQRTLSPISSPSSSPRLSSASQLRGGGGASPSAQMQPPTELMFAISRDRLDWFPFLGTVLDRTSAIRVDFHSLNKWLPLLDQSILLPNPRALSQPLGGSTVEQLRRKSVAQQQLSNLMASCLPSATLTTDQINPSDPPPQTYPIRSIEFRGTGGTLQAPAIKSLTRLLSLAPHLEILSVADFDIESTADWECVLGSIGLKELRQISLQETNVNGHHLALFMNRVPVGSSLKVMNLTKTDLKGQDVEGLRRAIDERIPGCRLVA